MTEKDRQCDTDSMQGNRDGIVSAVNRIEEPLSVPAREQQFIFMRKKDF